MINKIYKIINNKFSRFFKFVFFLRYLFIIFFVSTGLFLIVPQFFNYEKKEAIIKSYIAKNYEIEMREVGEISYKAFPTPHLLINNTISGFKSQNMNFKTKKFIIYPKLLSLYNYENFDVRKIRLESNEIDISPNKIKIFAQSLLNIKKKLYIQNSNVKILDQNNNILNLKKINFSNYGYNKNIIVGEVFNQSFKIKFKDKLNKINFKLLDIGVFADLKINENRRSISNEGELKGKVLNSNFKINFIYDNDALKINNFYYRDQNLSFDSNGEIDFKPFFKIYLNSEIKNINLSLLNNLDIDKILKNKSLIKRLNNHHNIIFRSKRFSYDLINYLDLKLITAYGRLNVTKKFLISDSNFDCKINVNLLEEYPILDFACIIDSPNKKNLLKKFDVNYKIKNEKFYLSTRGNLNILNKKINFDSIKVNNNLKFSQADLNYFKKTFENILFDKNFLKLFELSKIKKFILEIL